MRRFSTERKARAEDTQTEACLESGPPFNPGSRVSGRCCESEVARSCPTLRPRGLYLPRSSIPGNFQARVLERVALSFFRGFSGLGDRAWVSRICKQTLYRLSHRGNPQRCCEGGGKSRAQEWPLKMVNDPWAGTARAPTAAQALPPGRPALREATGSIPERPLAPRGRVPWRTGTGRWRGGGGFASLCRGWFPQALEKKESYCRLGRRVSRQR